MRNSKRDIVDREYSYELLNLIHRICKNSNDEKAINETQCDDLIKYIQPEYIEKIAEELKKLIEDNSTLSKQKKIEKIKGKLQYISDTEANNLLETEIDKESSVLGKNEAIKIIHGIRKNKGPLNKFWIMNISSFQTAFMDRMREQGLGHNNPHWTLSRGGDPVNTPQLFRYSLYRLMRMQQKTILFNVDDIIQFFGGNPVPNNNGEIKHWARNVFGCFISRFYSREMLEKDRGHKSLFAISALDLADKDQNVKQAYNLVEHFRQLLYILAFDPGSNMPLALQQLYIIRRKLNNNKDNKYNNDNNDNNDNNSNNPAKSLETNLFSKIEEYCIKVIHNHK